MSRVRNKADYQSRTIDFDGNTSDDPTFDNVTVTGTINMSVPFTPARLSSTQRDALVGEVGGDLIYNTTTQVMEVYQNGQWSSFDSKGIVFPTGDLGNLTQDYQTLGSQEIGTATNFDCERTIVSSTEDLGPGLT